jgi:hypothetical protein
MIKFKSAFEAAGTTKKNHGYHDFYAQMLDGVDIGSVLEIGVYLGQSLKAWKMVWPDAVIEGVDYDRRYGEDIAEEFNIYNFDSRVAKYADIYIDRKYDLIIDDGLHHWAAQIETFNSIRRFVNKFYVIEDITGEYSQKKLLENLPKNVLDRSTLFEAYGPTRTFTHGDNVEREAQYRVLFIDFRS